MNFVTRLTIGSLLTAVCASQAFAQPAPVLNAAPPMALKQGQSIEVGFSGQNLASLASASIADANGVSVGLLKPAKPNANEVRVKISATNDAPPGEREWRLVGPAGVSKPLRIFVSQYNVVAEIEPNNQFEQAQAVQFPATLVGRIDGAGDIDQFRFSAVKGQHLIFDVHAARMGSPLDPVVTIHSSNRREMSSKIEHHGGDPLIVFDAPSDGQFILRVRDLQYRGGADYDYRIDAGQIPYLESLLPSSGRPGPVIQVKAMGHNLQNGDNVTVDLSMSAPGRIEVRARTPLGLSNPAAFEVTELPQVTPAGPNHSLEAASAVQMPAEVSAAIERPGMEDFYKVHVPYKQVVSLEVLASRYGSPVTPLLQLRNVKGEIIESNDGTPDADARIIRELDAGDYLASLRDLTFAGGQGYWYRLKVEPAGRVPQDFAVQFLPDAPLLHRGGNVAMWCEVKRFNGFHGDVTITPEGLPAGVSGGPITLGEDASGWFTFAASGDAALGSVPIRLRATATIGAVPITHYAIPELDGRATQEAFLTVLEPAPFNVQAVATMTPQLFEQMNGQIQSLAARLEAPSPRFDASLAQWEKKVSDRPVWTVLNPTSATSSKSTALIRQPDGSFLASGNFPAQDDYTVTAHTDLKGVTAVRLEVLADDRLPAHGPGAAPNGNFVLTEFKLKAADEGKPLQPVMLRNATSDFAQADYPVAAAIDNNPGTGWAVDPQQGRNHVAMFQTAAAVGSGDATILQFVLECQSVFPHHNIGRFRISVTTASPAALSNEVELPPQVLAIISTPAELRTSAQKDELIAYFRTIDPETSADRTRLEALRSFVAPYAEMDRLQKAIATGTPQLDAEQAQWEQSLAAGARWSVLDLDQLKSASGARLQKQPDGSVFVDGVNPAVDAYTLAASTPLKSVTGIRLEALPDARLGANGPGRSPGGNFVLTRFQVATAPRTASTQPALAAPMQDAAIDSARATFEQPGYGIAGALDDKDQTGWGILPNVGRPADATFYLKQPITGDAGSAMQFNLEFRSAFPQHTLGHFRIWVTGNREPAAAPRLPQNIATILNAPPGGRSEAQKREIAAYFRSVAPSLDPLRQRLSDLKSQVPSLPLKLTREEKGAIPVPIDRMGEFAGDVQITLEGFAKGREGNMPKPITKELRLNPLTLGAGKLFGTLTFEPEREAEPGTRMVVLKAEAKIGNDTVVEYSPAFPLTIEK